MIWSEEIIVHKKRINKQTKNKLTTQLKKEID